MRCLGNDLKFHWVYNKSNNVNESKPEYKTPFDIDMHAFVRELLPANPAETPPSRASQLAKLKIRYIDAVQYAIEASVKGTMVSYQVPLSYIVVRESLSD